MILNGLHSLNLIELFKQTLYLCVYLINTSFIESSFIAFAEANLGF
jgi:hypothetical protein